MPSFPYVKKGDEFKPNMQLDNAVRRIVNQHYQQIMSQGVVSKKGNTGKVSVYNVGTTVIPAGSAVVFEKGDEKKVYDGAIPCKLSETAAATWGIVTDDLSPNSVGSCVVSGAVAVQITGTGDFASPAKDGKIVAGSTGAPVIYRTADTAVINLGGGSGGGYLGPFAVSIVENGVYIAPGYAEVNLTSFEILGDFVEASSFSSFYVYIRFYINNEHELTIGYITEISTTRLSSEIGRTYIAIAYIDENKNVTQLQYGDIHATVWGECAFPTDTTYYDI